MILCARVPGKKQGKKQLGKLFLPIPCEILNFPAVVRCICLRPNLGYLFFFCLLHNCQRDSGFLLFSLWSLATSKTNLGANFNLDL